MNFQNSKNEGRGTKNEMCICCRLAQRNFLPIACSVNGVQGFISVFPTDWMSLCVRKASFVMREKGFGENVCMLKQSQTRASEGLVYLH